MHNTTTIFRINWEKVVQVLKKTFEKSDYDHNQWFILACDLYKIRTNFALDALFH